VSAYAPTLPTPNLPAVPFRAAPSRVHFARLSFNRFSLASHPRRSARPHGPDATAVAIQVERAEPSPSLYSQRAGQQGGEVEEVRIKVGEGEMVEAWRVEDRGRLGPMGRIERKPSW